MADIVERLRKYQVRRRDGTSRPTPKVVIEAADEIERLTERVAALVEENILLAACLRESDAEKPNISDEVLHYTATCFDKSDERLGGGVLLIPASSVDRLFTRITVQPLETCQATGHLLLFEAEYGERTIQVNGITPTMTITDTQHFEPTNLCCDHRSDYSIIVPAKSSVWVVPTSALPNKGWLYAAYENVSSVYSFGSSSPIPPATPPRICRPPRLLRRR